MASLEGLMLKLEDETPIAWAFLGIPLTGPRI